MTLQLFKDSYPKIGEQVYIDSTALVIGKVTIDDQCSIWPMAVVRGDVNQIQIGARTNIQDGSILHVTHAGPFNPNGFALTLGCDITIGHRVTLHGCILHDRCLIGMSSTIMDGAIVESDVIVAAGSLVTPGKILSSGHLWAGSPARQIRPITEEEISFIGYSAQYYVKLKNSYLQIPT